MRRVVVESPFAGDVAANIHYARACIRHCLVLGEAPMAMHLLYTQPGILDDTRPDQRQKGMEAAFFWYSAADACVVYGDLGISEGMKAGMRKANELGLQIDFRYLPQVLLADDRLSDPFPDARLLTAAQIIDNAGGR